MTHSRAERAFLAGVARMDPSTRAWAESSLEEVESLFAEERIHWDLSRLYFEAHITVEPCHGNFDLFREAWSDGTWRVSSFSEDDVDGIQGKWFITCRDTSYQQIRAQVALMVSGLEHAGHTVLRYKIEDTLLDSKHGDKLP